MDPALISTLMSMFGGGGGNKLSGISQDENGAINRSYGGGQGLIGGGNLSGVGQILSGLFGNSDDPFRAGSKELGDFYNRGRDIQNPFMQYGQGAMPKMNEWLEGQRDPSGFINNLMGQYSESPWAKFQQDQSARRFANAGSRGDLGAGGTGSTPLLDFQQQNMQNISSQDMQQWLGKVLGINTQYGQGLQNQVGVGQTAANSLTDLTSNFGKGIAGMQYGAKAGENQDRNSIWGGLFG